MVCAFLLEGLQRIQSVRRDLEIMDCRVVILWRLYG